jgi:hypothetical protein
MNPLTSNVSTLIGLTGVAIGLSIIALKFASFLSDMVRELFNRL